MITVFLAIHLLMNVCPLGFLVDVFCQVRVQARVRVADFDVPYDDTPSFIYTTGEPKRPDLPSVSLP